MMKIGFKNFRRFKDFPMIELGGCTFLVGPNNSGKSTLLKAIVLVQNNRRHRPGAKGVTDPILWDFNFAPEGQVEHLFLGDFASNLNSNSLEKELIFNLKTKHVDLSFTIDGNSLVDNEPSILVPLKKITAYVSKYDIRFEWNFIDGKSGFVQYTYNPKVVVNWLWNEYWYDVKKGNHDYNSGSFVDKESKFAELSYMPLSSERLDVLRKEIELFIAELEKEDSLQTRTEKFNHIKNNISYKNVSKRHKFITAFLEAAIDRARYDFWNRDSLKYIETHNASHKVLLNPEDKNDYLAQTILLYKKVIGVEKENDACSFIEKWMKIFKIGDSFIIKSIYNEAFTVDIIDNNGKTKSLGYLGTGSIQLFILLLNIAMAIAFNRKIMLSIEEPEQNLHPALQSRLAEMFYEVWKNTDGKVEFLVETHSEYLVRQTQVIAAKAIANGEYTTDEVNDIFKVYYFPEEGLPYSMNYRQNGYFEKPFGTGFYDASGNLSRELYKIDRRL